jgi:hypothetical protein
VQSDRSLISHQDRIQNVLNGGREGVAVENPNIGEVKSQGAQVWYFYLLFTVYK